MFTNIPTNVAIYSLIVMSNADLGLMTKSTSKKRNK